MSEAEIKVRNYVDTEQLKKDLAYSSTNLSDAMMAQASMFAHYGVQAAYAAKQVNSLELLIENHEARVYRELRDKAIADGEKVTEALLERRIAQNTTIIKMKRLLNEAKQIEAIAKTASEAFRHRRDMLIQEGFTSREEMKGQLAIHKKRESEETFEGLKERALNRLRTGE